MPSLYANIASGNGTVPPNNNTSLYNANGVPQAINDGISVTGNIIAGGYISAAGNVYGANLITTGNVSAGNIIGNIVLPGGNTEVIFNNNDTACSSPAFTFNNSSNVMAVTGAITATGNITGNYILGNGSQLTGLPATYGNSNVTTLLSSFGSNTVSTTGNITAGYFLGDGSQLTNLPASNYSNANVANFLPTYSGAITANTVSATGNVTGNYILGDGSQLTNLPIPGVYGNANVATFLAAFGSNVISTTGNVTAGAITATGNITGNYFVGNGSQLTGLPATYSNADVATFLANFGSNAISTTGNITTGNIHTGLISASGNVTISGNLFSDDISSANVTVYGDTVITGNLTVQGNTTTINSNVVTTNDKTITVANNQSTSANIDGAGLEAGNATIATWLYNALTQSWQSNIAITPVANVSLDLGVGNRYWNNLYAANAVVTTVSATGNITGNMIIGDGSQLSNITAGNITGAYSNVNVSAFMAAFGSNNISTTGNVTTGNIIGNGQFLTNLPGANVTGSVTQANTANTANAVAGANVTGQVANALVAGTVYTNAQPNITTVGTLTSVSVTGNTNSGNILTGGTVSATGNITGNYILGNGSQLTGITATYANANVAAFMAAFGSNTISTTGTVTAGNVTGGNIITGGLISATGNITGNYILGNGSQLTGITAGGSPAGTNLNFQYNNSGNFGGVPNTFFYSGNGVIEIASAKFEAGAGPSSQITVPGTAGYVSVVGNVIAGNVNVAGRVSATGNIAGNYFIGNGSQLANIAAGGSANTLQFNNSGVFGGIPDSFHYTANGITEISKVKFSSTAAGGGSGELFVPGTAGYVSVTGNVIAGNVTGGNILTVGQVSATGNVTGNFFVGNGSQLTGVAANIAAGGSANTLQFNNGGALGGITDAFHYTANGITEISKIKFSSTASGGGSGELFVPGTVGYVSVVGNIIGGNITSAGVISAVGNITAANLGNVSALNLNGNSSQVLYGNGVFAAVTGGGGSPGGSPFQFQYNNSGNFGGIPNTNYYSGNGIIEMALTKFEATGVSGVVTVPGSAGYVSVTGNVIAGNVFTGGTVSATGNITGNYILGNGSQLTGITASAGGSNTQLQFNNAGALAGNAAMTFDVSSGNVTLGNIRFNNNVIVNSNSFQSNTNPNPGRILIGTGRNGNYSGLGTFGNNATSTRLFVQDEIFKYDDGLRTAMVVGSLYANLSGGNIGTANSNSRLTAVQGETYVISGNAVGTVTNTYRGASFSLNLGNSANTSNAFVSNGTTVATFIGVNAGSSANTLIGTNFATTFNGAVANLIGYSFTAGGSANVTGNVAGYFMANTTSQYALSTGNIARQVTNYHAFRNDDDLARSRLGMLERFHELNANTANTTGTVDIDKNSGQVQTLYPTGNITVGTLSNFVTRVTKPDATFVNAADTVTLVINQGATPYTVTMPTGNTQIRYASGVSTVLATANTTTMISITGTYNYTTAANQYQITISPEFS